MANRVQTLRSNVPGARPIGRLPGELYVSWPDFQLGVIDSTNAPRDLLAIRFFSALTSYAIGDHVVQGDNIYRALVDVAPGPFNPAQWQGNAAGDFVEKGGDTMLGPLVLAGAPVANLEAATKLYVDAHLPLIGGTMTGPLILDGDAVQPLEPVTKRTFDAHPMIGDNRIINGDMRIDQRWNGANQQSIGYTVDRWAYYATQVNIITWGRTGSSLVTGLSYSLGTSTINAYTSVATDAFQFVQSIEADMISDFQWGTANAQQVTLTFWALCTLTGTFSGCITDGAGTRSYPFTFLLPTANTQTKIIITIPGDTAGTWVMSGNGSGLGLHFDLGSGANFRGPANAWAAASYTGATGSVSPVSVLNAEFSITGVKLEIGSVATPFNRQSLAKSMADCQRYYQTGQLLLSLGGSAASGAGQSFGVSSLRPVAMRAVATMTLTLDVSTNLNPPILSGNSDMFEAQSTSIAAGAVTLNCVFAADAEL